MKSLEWWRVNLKVGSRVQLQAPPWLILETHSNILRTCPLKILNTGWACLIWPPPPSCWVEPPTPPALSAHLGPSRDTADPLLRYVMKFIQCQRKIHLDLIIQTKNYRLRKWLWKSYRKLQARKWKMGQKYIKTRPCLQVFKHFEI